MIDKKTVFILGAGASKPYGFPTGQELMDKISVKFSSVYDFYFDKRDYQIYDLPTQKKINNFAGSLRDSSNPSVDIWLSRNPTENMQIGKYAIAMMLLEYEAESKFREYSKVDSDWYKEILNRMIKNFTRPDSLNLSLNKVSFITFNYERSLEHFLFDSLVNSYTEISHEIVIQNIKAIPIVHVYGKFMDLPWQNKLHNVRYGMNKMPYALMKKVIQSLKIVYEEPNSEYIKKAKELIKEADQIFFLGFGFHNENLEILGLPDLLKIEQEIFATAFGSTEKERNDIKSKLIKHDRNHDNRNRINIRDMNCLELLKEYL